METSSIPALDLEATPVQGQVASAVLDLQGHIVRGQLSTEHDAEILYKMLVEAGNLPSLQGGDFSRMTVTFPTTRYIVARDQAHIYIVQART